MDEPGKTRAALTVRQTEILVLLARGWVPKEIGQWLGITEAMIKQNLRSARIATGAKTTIQLAAMVAVQRERDRMRRDAIPIEGTLPAA